MKRILVKTCFYSIVVFVLLLTQGTWVASAMTTQQKQEYLAKYFAPCPSTQSLSYSCPNKPTPISQKHLHNYMDRVLKNCRWKNRADYNSEDFEVNTWGYWFTIQHPTVTTEDTAACWLRRCENARGLSGSTSFFDFEYGGDKNAKFGAKVKGYVNRCGSLTPSLKAYVHQYQVKYCRALDYIEHVLEDIDVNRTPQQKKQLGGMIQALKMIGYDIWEGRSANDWKACQRTFAAKFDWATRENAKVVTREISQVRPKKKPQTQKPAPKSTQKPASKPAPKPAPKPASKPAQPQATHDQKSGKLVPGNRDEQKTSQGSFIKRGAVYQSSYSVAIENCTKMVDPVGGIVSIQASDGKVLQGTPRGMTATERQDCKDGAYKRSLQNRDMLPEQVKDPTFEKLGEKLGSCTRTSATADKKVYHCTKIKIFNKKIKVTPPQHGESVIEFYKKGGFAVTQGTVEMLFDDVNNIVPPQKPQEKEKAKKKLPKGFKLFSNQCVDKGELIEDAGAGINWETSCPVEFETQGKHVRISPDWEKNPPVKLFIDPDGKYTLFNGIEEIILQPATPADTNKPEVKAEQNNSEKKDKPGDNAEEKSTNPDPKTDPEKPGGVADGQSTTGSADGTNDPNALTGDGNGGGIPVPDTLSNRVKQFFVRWTQGGKKISYVISPFKRDLEEEERQMQAAVNGEEQYE